MPGSFHGRYNDGEVAKTTLVDVEVTDAGVRLTADGLQVDFWPAAEVHLAAPPDPAQPLRLQRGDTSVRLIVADPSALPVLETHCPSLNRNLKTSRRQWRKIAGWSAAAIAVVAVLLVVVIPLGGDWLASRVPPALEARLGRQTADQLIRLFARFSDSEPAELVCNGQPGTQVIADLTNRFAPPGDTEIPIQVTVLDHPLVNAFALPGGQIILFRGLIEADDNPNLVVGVLAHEIGHVQHHHPTAVALKTGAGVGLIGLIVGDFGGAAAIAATAQALLSSSYSREAEAEADLAAIAILNRHNIAAEPLAEFFSGLSADLPFEIPEYFATHPADGSRAETFRTLGTGTASAMTPAEWQAVQQICG